MKGRKGIIKSQIGQSMGGSPMYVEESDDVVECTPTKFLPTSKNSLRNRGQNAITPQTVKIKIKLLVFKHIIN